MWKTAVGYGLAGLKKLGWIGAGVGTVAVGETVANGPDGMIGNVLQTGSNTVKNVDSITDVDGLFTRFARFIQNIMKAVNNIGGIIDGSVDLKTLFTDDTTTTGKGTPDTPNNVQNTIENLTPNLIDRGNTGVATGIAATGASAYGLHKLSGYLATGANAAGAGGGMALGNATSGKLMNIFTGSTKLGRLVRIGALSTGIGLGAGTIANAATPEETTLPAEYTSEEVLANAPAVNTEFDGARATSVGLDGLYNGMIDGVSSLGYAVDAVDWVTDKIGLTSEDSQPFLGRDHIHATLTQAYNGYADNVAPQLNQEPQNNGEMIAEMAGNFTGQLVGAFGLAKGLQAAGQAATTTQIVGFKEGIDVTKAMTPAMP